MKYLGNALLLASALLALIAACVWWRASQVVGDPFFGRGEGGIVELNHALMTGANTEAINLSARLNRKAAMLTGLSVGLGAIGNILSVFN